MTDLTSSVPLTISRPAKLRLSLPKIRVGNMFSAPLAALGRAFELAYVTPYLGHRQKPASLPDLTEDGRDPNW